MADQVNTGATPGLGATPANVQGQQPTGQVGATPSAFEDWLNGQDAGVKSLVTQRFADLESTVKATREERDGYRVARDERDALASQVKDLLKKAERGSELEKSLQEFQGKLEASERRAAFLESATQPGIDCKNPKAALAIANAGNLFNRQGLPDWTAIKAEAPELFGRVIPQGNAGAGTGIQPQVPDMNALIRGAAGR